MINIKTQYVPQVWDLFTTTFLKLKQKTKPFFNAIYIL